MAKRKSTAPPNYARINPAILSWALTRSGLTRETVAESLHVTPDVVAEWEKADGPPPLFDQAVNLAECLGVPFGYLFLSQPPIRKPGVPDRRTLPVSAPLSLNFQRLLSDTLVRRDWYRQHAIEQGAKPLEFVGSVKLSDDRVRVATDIRRVLKLTDRDRRDGIYGWRDYLTLLTKRAENAGVLVMRSGVVGNSKRAVDSSEAQGFAIADEYAPVVFVNSSDFLAARIFTMAHELVHIWLGQSAVSNPHQGSNSERGDAVEVFCNAVATELLVPARAFRVAWLQMPPRTRVDDLVRRYWVSARVVLRRARELNLITFDEYHALRDKAIAAETARGKKKGKPDYYTVATSRAGRRLTDAVLLETNRGSLQIAEGASLLGMNVNTFAKFAEMSQ